MKAKFVSESLRKLKEDFYDDDDIDNMLIYEEPPATAEEEDIEVSAEDEIEMQDEFETAIKNELTVPETSRRTIVFKVKGESDIIEAIPMAKMKAENTYLMKVGDKLRKFNLNDIIEESFKVPKKKDKKLFEGSYEDFIMNNIEEIKEAIQLLKMFQKKMEGDEISEDEYGSTMEKYENIYDPEVIEWIDSKSFPGARVTPEEIAKLGIFIQNNYGTEMSMVLNAVYDVTSDLNIYADMPEDYE